MAAATRRKARKSRESSGKSHDYGQRLLDDALAVGGTLIRSRKNFGAERLQAFADATREYAGSLEDVPGIGSYVTMASDSVEALADYIVETDLEDMVSDASAFARSQPLVTLLIAVSAGLIATFVVRSQLGHGFAWPGASIARASKRAGTRRRPARKSGRRAPVRTNGPDHPSANA